MLAHATPDSSVTFILDAMQRIYPRYYQWSDLGIEVRPAAVYHFRANHRNTPEIARLALPLVSGLPLEDDGSLPDFNACVGSSGQIPKVLARRYNQLRLPQI